jgi:GTP cyclohydrolase III
MFTARAGGEPVDAVTQAVEAVTNVAQNAEKEEKKNQPESVSNEWVLPLAEF